jgi:cytosine/adenosine deaminase-related metal-dependent hydrolase
MYYKFLSENFVQKLIHKIGTRDAYERVVETTLAWGTTAAAYYATIGRRTTEILCDVAEIRGQRALVGKVSRDRHWPVLYTKYCSVTGKACYPKLGRLAN